MESAVLILVLNTGSTSTKLAVFRDQTEIHSVTLNHSAQELEKFNSVLDQIDFRKKAVVDFLNSCGLKPKDFQVIAARGGSFGIFHGGAYLIDDNIYSLASKERPGFKAIGSWLAVLIAYTFSKEVGIPAYFYDPVFTDEMTPLARYSGMSFIQRRAGGHPLNCKEASRRAAAAIGKPVEECSFIVCHLGGGISTEMHYHGKMIDTQTFTEGTFTPERAGRIPNTFIPQFMCSDRFPDEKSLMKFMRGGGGLVDYLGTNSVVEVEQRIDAGDKKAEEVLQAMAYQVSKDIGSIATTVCGKVDRIILTGGVAHSDRFTSWIRERVEFIAPVIIYPGTFEMEALANGIYRVYTGQEKYEIYTPE